MKNQLPIINYQLSMKKIIVYCLLFIANCVKAQSCMDSIVIVPKSKTVTIQKPCWDDIADEYNRRGDKIETQGKLINFLKKDTSILRKKVYNYKLFAMEKGLITDSLAEAYYKCSEKYKRQIDWTAQLDNSLQKSKRHRKWYVTLGFVPATFLYGLFHYIKTTE